MGFHFEKQKKNLRLTLIASTLWGNEFFLVIKIGWVYNLHKCQNKIQFMCCDAME
jgi:hypothetical protein